MNDSINKKFIEKHIEAIFAEIWASIENKFRAQIHDVDLLLHDFGKKVTFISRRHLLLKKDLTALNAKLDDIMHCQKDINILKDIGILRENLYSKMNKISVLSNKIDDLYSRQEEASLLIKEIKKLSQSPLNESIQSLNAHFYELQNAFNKYVEQKKTYFNQNIFAKE